MSQINIDTGQVLSSFIYLHLLREFTKLNKSFPLQVAPF